MMIYGICIYIWVSATKFRFLCLFFHGVGHTKAFCHGEEAWVQSGVALGRAETAKWKSRTNPLGAREPCLIELFQRSSEIILHKHLVQVL